MSGPRRWTPLETELLQECAVFTVSRTRTRSPKDGGLHDFYRIDSNDWVNIVPVTPAGEVVMIRQYRHGLRDVTLEIPGGMVDPGESPADAAAREQHAVGLLVVVAADVVRGAAVAFTLQHRRTAKLRPDHDQRFIQQATLPQIAN